MNRIALVIGNSAYVNVSKLNNPKNDANDIASVLHKLDSIAIQKILWHIYFYANLRLQVRNDFFPSRQRESEMLLSSNKECNSYLRRRSIREREDIVVRLIAPWAY